uniref:Flagellar biosynthetic protein FliQ n=1 Tax=Thermodesulfovibrio aggregans TaxID=86166 RepID=A0A7C4EKH4_9BACT
MTVEFLNYISKQTLETVLLVGGPVLLVSLLVGVLIGLFQAITQLQEMTISFVPKVIAVFLTLLITLPWIVNIMTKFTRGIFENLPLYVK